MTAVAASGFTYFPTVLKREREIQEKLYLYKPLRFMQHGREVNNNLHAPGALSPGKELPLRIK
jgi:hypothetical protein